ncbi:MAG TPA: zinc ribbon domain-containing protein [Candidatus Dormibacteraeota bacterium]|nr:zinc ribbon domain-containing protein [Candidatus Dormibacteraeota bacterium]
MALYEYRCNECTAVFEVLRPMADRELSAICPNCESRASMPLISMVAARGAASEPDVAASGGGCCGGSCGCGLN